MAEMPDVATLTTITSDWGNDIRDRTIQRYSSVTNRTTEHSTPAEGDLSYLEDSNTVWVYDGAAWVQLVPGPVATANIADSAVTAAKLADTAISGGWVDMAQVVNPAPIVLSTTFQDCASVAISFTTLGWGSGRLLAWGGVGADGPGAVGLNVRIDIASSAGTTTTLPPSAAGDVYPIYSGASHAFTTPTSGNKIATIQASKIGATVTTMRLAWICMWAVRTS